MKLFKLCIGAVGGILCGTLLAWGGLYLFGKITLGGHGSLFDERPDIANAFFVGWFVLMGLCALVGAFLTRERTKY